MADYLFVKDPLTGKSTIREAPVQAEVVPIKVTQPGTTLPGRMQRFRCTVEGCGKKFATQGVAAIHYNRSHRQGDSKEEWRSFVESITDGVNAS